MSMFRPLIARVVVPAICVCLLVTACVIGGCHGDFVANDDRLGGAPDAPGEIGRSGPIGAWDIGAVTFVSGDYTLTLLFALMAVRPDDMTLAAVHHHSMDLWKWDGVYGLTGATVTATNLPQTGDGDAVMLDVRIVFVGDTFTGTARIHGGPQNVDATANISGRRLPS